MSKTISLDDTHWPNHMKNVGPNGPYPSYLTMEPTPETHNRLLDTLFSLCESVVRTNGFQVAEGVFVIRSEKTGECVHCRFTKGHRPDCILGHVEEARSVAYSAVPRALSRGEDEPYLNLFPMLSQRQLESSLVKYGKLIKLANAVRAAGFTMLNKRDPSMYLTSVSCDRVNPIVQALIELDREAD